MEELKSEALLDLPKAEKMVSSGDEERESCLAVDDGDWKNAAGGSKRCSDVGLYRPLGSSFNCSILNF